MRYVWTGTPGPYTHTVISTPRPPRRPTISDVAARAGVSKALVSRYFNTGKGVGPETTERIRSAAADLGWTPSGIARALSGSAALAVGVVIRRPAELLELDPFFPAFLAGVESALGGAGYASVIRFVNDATAERDSYLRLATERRVDGFLLTDLRANDPRYRLLTELEMPAIAIGTPPASCPFPSVDTASDDQVRELIERFIADGHRRIGHVTGQPGMLHAEHRRRIWQRTLSAAGLESGPLVRGDFTARGGARATEELVAGSGRPTAIFYSNDIMAIAGMSVLAELGLRVPDDVAIAGFDDISLASYVTPQLTSVHCEYRALGAAAAERLLELIGGAEVPRRMTFPSAVRHRGSSAAPAKRRRSAVTQR